MLTIEEVKENPALTDSFVRQNRGLVINTVNKNFTNAMNRDEYEDIIQEGFLALYKSIDKFDVSKGFKFSTYAVTNIVGNIKNYYRTGFESIGLSVTAEMRIDWRKYNFLNSRGFTDEEIAKKMNKTLSVLAELKRNMMAVVSLDGLVQEDIKEADIYNIIPSDYNLEDECEVSQEVLDKANIIGKYLSVKHYKAIMLKLNYMTHEEIAKKLEIKLSKVKTLFNEIKKSYVFVTQYYDGVINKETLINEINIICGKSDIMQKKIKYDDVVKMIVEWAIKHPGESITRKCVDGDIEGSFSDAKMNAIQLLRSEGYVIQQNGVTFKLIEKVIEDDEIIEKEIDHKEQYHETLRQIDIKDLSNFMNDLVVGLNSHHDKVLNLVSQLRETQQKNILSIKEQELTAKTAKDMLKTVEQIINIAESNGKRVQATILIDEI